MKREIKTFLHERKQRILSSLTCPEGITLETIKKNAGRKSGTSGMKEEQEE
jgi:hypothetical protein